MISNIGSGADPNVNVLVLNAGSSTLKCAIFRSGTSRDPIWKGVLDWGDSLQEAAEQLLATAEGDIDAVGHRVVHGGKRFSQPTQINSDVKSAIRKLCPLAPLHNPANLLGIEIIEKILPDVPQVAVFDTAFHRTMDEAIATYPGPYSWREQGIRRYGFHGISHQYCTERALELHSGRKVITCHLGNGCSLAASIDGKCVDTTMGFTPMEGLMMGTRCGSLDPGIILHLLQKMSPDEVDHLLNRESGLKGICGHSDMRVILEWMHAGDAKAKLAFSMFVHRLKAYIGAMAASIGGLDILVFTAGIGENAPLVRKEACAGLQHLGVVLDDERNVSCTPDQPCPLGQGNDLSGRGLDPSHPNFEKTPPLREGSPNASPRREDQDISASESSVRIFVIHTREEWAIAQACFRLQTK